MRHLHLLNCAVALAALAMFSGCGEGDNNGSNSDPASASAQETNSPCPGAIDGQPGPDLIGKTFTADNGDSITLTTATDYSASFGGNAESGTYTYSPSGDKASLVLMPTAGTQSTIDITLRTAPPAVTPSRKPATHAHLQFISPPVRRKSDSAQTLVFIGFLCVGVFR